MHNNLYCYYRISDAGNPLGRTELGDTFLASLNRKKCLVNFIDAFGVDDLIVIADNASDDTIDYVLSQGVKLVNKTNLGNTGSFFHIINKAIMGLKPEDIFYSVEDDYLHTLDAREYIFEGLEIADYVSLYDSLDKYIDTNKGGNNPLISDGGEDTKVILGKSSHFKLTNATTCTFAAKVKTLQEDYEVFRTYCHPDFVHPSDFAMFRYLITNKRRKLVCPIPGKASHVGLELSPFVDWQEIVENLEE